MEAKSSLANSGQSSTKNYYRKLMKEENDKDNEKEKEKRLSKDADIQLFCIFLLLGVVMLSLLLSLYS